MIFTWYFICKFGRFNDWSVAARGFVVPVLGYAHVAPYRSPLYDSFATRPECNTAAQVDWPLFSRWFRLTVSVLPLSILYCTFLFSRHLSDASILSDSACRSTLLTGYHSNFYLPFFKKYFVQGDSDKQSSEFWKKRKTSVHRDFFNRLERV